MKTKKANKHYAVLPASVIGVALAVAVSLVLSMITTYLALREIIQESRIHYFSFAVLLLSSIAGSTAAMKLAARKYALVGAAVAAAYLLLLLATNLLCFDGSLLGVWPGILAVLIGYAASCAVCVRVSQNGRKRKIKAR